MTNFTRAADFALIRQHLMEALKGEGRDPASFPTAIYHNINIGKSRSDCFAETKRFFEAYYASGTPDDALVDQRTVAGEPSECIDQLLHLGSTGVRHIALRLSSFRQESQFKLLIDDVLPAVTSQLLTR
jgi:hypothetical protein